MIPAALKSIPSQKGTELSQDLLEVVAIIGIIGVLVHCPPAPIPEMMVGENAFTLKPTMLEGLAAEQIELIDLGIYFLQVKVCKQVPEEQRGCLGAIAAPSRGRAEHRDNRAMPVDAVVVVAEDGPNALARCALFDD
jgi:hypothetical protein